MAGKAKDRRQDDFYPTPRWMTDHLLDRLDLNLRLNGRNPVILEPCVGEGHIINAIRARWRAASFLTNDLDYRHDAGSHVDATGPGLWSTPGNKHFDWVISNPPFSAAFDIVRNAVEVAQVGVAMLLRITWLEPTKTGARAAWLAANPPKWLLIMERYAFDGSGKQDSATTAWMVWSKYLDPRIEIIFGRAPATRLLD